MSVSEPFRRRAKTGETIGPDLLAYLGDNIADGVLLQLLGEGTLLLHVLALTVAECLVDIGGTTRADQVDFLEIDSRLVASIHEHGPRLAALETDKVRSFQLIPKEVRVGFAAGQEKSVHLINLREVFHLGRFTLAQRRETLAQCRLRHMSGTVQQRLDS